MDSSDTFNVFYSNNHPNRAAHLDALAEQLATFCVTLGEYPLIRHRLYVHLTLFKLKLLISFFVINRSDYTENVEFANLVQKKLDKYKADNPLMGEVGNYFLFSILYIIHLLYLFYKGIDKSSSELIILDRGFDAVSPFIHDLTYQAMANDLIDIKNNIYSYNTKKDSLKSIRKEALLDEYDELWLKLRHLHIAEVLQ